MCSLSSASTGFPKLQVSPVRSDDKAREQRKPARATASRKRTLTQSLNDEEKAAKVAKKDDDSTPDASSSKGKAPVKPRTRGQGIAKSAKASNLVRDDDDDAMLS